MRRFAIAGLACLVMTVQAVAGGLPFEPEEPHYFEQFDPAQKPWQPGPALNIEEVFKNYQYYEIRILKQGTEILVRRHINGRQEGLENFRILPDGSLDKVLR